LSLELVRKHLGQERYDFVLKSTTRSLSEGQWILKLSWKVQIKAVVRKQVLKVMEKDSEKNIGVTTARNEYTIQLKGASIDKHKHGRRHESAGNHGDDSVSSETQGRH